MIGRATFRTSDDSVHTREYTPCQPPHTCQSSGSLYLLAQNQCDALLLVLHVLPAAPHSLGHIPALSLERQHVPVSANTQALQGVSKQAEKLTALHA
jgi:hypothetical protein